MADSIEVKDSLSQAKAAAFPESYIDWGAIIGGALLAVILSFILFTFGSALGLSAVSVDNQEGISLRWLAIAGGIWLIWTMVTSSAVGSYFAGRMRKPTNDANKDEIELRDGSSGLVSWAVATIFTLALAGIGIGTALSGVLQGSANLLESSSEGISSLVEENSAELAGLVLRNENAMPSEVVRNEIASILSRSIQRGGVSESDRNYLATIVSREVKIDTDEAQTRIDNIIKTAEDAYKKAFEAAEQARIFSLIAPLY